MTPKNDFSRRPIWPGLAVGLLALVILIGGCSFFATSPQTPETPSPNTSATAAHILTSPSAGQAHGPTPVALSRTPSRQPYPPQSAQATDAYPPPESTAQPATPTVAGEAVSPLTVYLPVIFGGLPSPTPTPVPPPTTVPPTDTPIPPWPDPMTSQTASKLGLHVIAISNDSYVLQFVQHVHPRVINAPDDPAGLAKVKAISPSTVTLSRINVPGQNVWVDTVADAAAAAQHYVDVNLAQYRQYPGVDYWLGINEFNPQSVADWHWFTTFEATRACAMQAQGLHAAIGDFGVGWPNDYDQMTLFLPALEAAHRCGAIFTVHEYNGPTLDCGVGVNTAGIIPGAPALSVPAGSLTLRYRFWYESFLKPRQLGDLPLAITELATLGGPVEDKTCGGKGDMTWKAYQKSWIKLGYGTTGPQAFVNVLAWYDAELRKDPYVLGAAIFTSGELNGSPWWAFDIHDALIPLAQYETQLQP